MPSMPDNIRQALVALVPAALINEISCFIFYDNHPRDKKNVDVTICSFRGEVKEFYQRELVSSVVVEGYSPPGNISILRNKKCQLFYLLAFADEIIVISRTNELRIHYRIDNIDSYKIEDSVCTGKAYLKIVRKDDAVPLILDDNFNAIRETSAIFHKETLEEASPILTQLSRKLTEAKYSVKCNKKVLKDLVNLRQLSTYSSSTEACPNTGVIFQDKKAPHISLAIKTKKPWIRISNKKIVIIIEVTNNIEPIENIHVLLQNDARRSMMYTTKIFESISTAPYWREKLSHSLMKGDCRAVVVVIDFKELQYDITTRIDLSGVLCYRIKLKDYLTPFENISISSLDIMGEHFDVLFHIQKEEKFKYNILSLLATSGKTELSLRHIRMESDCNLHLLDLFCSHLCMEKVTPNMVIHLKSPYHILHGLVVVQEKEELVQDKWIISLYSRSESQILAFIQYMYDAIPYRIIASTICQKNNSKQPQLCQYNEDTSSSTTKVNYSSLGQSLLNQASMTLQYLDDCMIKMNESKNPKVLSKIGSEIDIFAGGAVAFKEFKKNMLEEEQKGLKSQQDENQHQEEFEGIVMDIDD